MRRKDATQIAGDLRQKDSTGDRTTAIRLLGKTLRGDRFQSVWDAVGGAAGLACLMAEFSVRDVRFMCRQLGNTASSEKARPERRESLGELVRLLYDDGQDDRPITSFYQDIVPACSLEVVQEWEQERKVEWTRSQLRRLSMGHRDRHEQEFLREVFSPNARGMKIEAHRSLFGGNLQFCGRVLSLLNAKEGYTQIPSDFTTKFVMPLLRRLLRRQHSIETRDDFLDRIIQCFQRHEENLANEIHIQSGGLLQYVIQRWVDARGDRKEEMKARVGKILALLPTKKHWFGLDAIYDGIYLPRRLAPEARYDLLQLFFRHVKGYEMSLEDGSASGLAKLSNLPVENDMWPTMLFFTIGIENGRSLLERLATAHPNSDFLKLDSYAGDKTVRKQSRDPDNDTRADVEIIRCLLDRRSSTESRNQAWLNRARSIVEERKKKSQQSREAKHRAFWAKSALNLCFAAGDLDMLADVVLWARRFNKDSPTAKELYGQKTLATREAVDLLSAIPRQDSPAATVASSESMAENIRLANKIIIDLFRTIAMAVQEPGFSISQWTRVLDLPKIIAHERCIRAESFEKAMESSKPEHPALESAEILWKPTMDAFLEVEELMSPLGYSSYVEASGVYVLEQIPNPKPPMLADLAKFLLERTKQRLGVERLRARMWSVVEIVMRVAKSGQPTLACPFIRDLIINGSDTSSWHRQLISVGFLSSLPAAAAKEFITTVADAIRDKMKEQNLRPIVQDGDKPRPSVIKVTTIKMMAQLLQNNLFIDAISSCNILTGLLAEARHIDAKITIVKSLISILEIPNCPTELRTRIFDAFAAHVVPTAAQLSERRPLFEADWAAAADSQGTLPDVGEEKPLLSMLLDQAENRKLSPEDKSRISRFIVAALEQSAVHNSRWMELFLAKNGFTLEINERLRMCPVSPDALASFTKDWISYIPVSLFQVHCSIISMQIDPPPAISHITEAVKSSRDLVNSNAGKHWLAQFDSPGTGTHLLHVSQAADVLQILTEDMVSNLKGADGVSVRMMQDFMLSVAEKYAKKGDNSSLYSLVLGLCQQRFESISHWRCWRSNCIPLFKEIIAMIEKTREDRKFQELSLDTVQGTQQLHVLPNTFRIKISTLPIPCPSSPFGLSVSTDEIDAFIAELSGLIDELASRRNPYHGDFELLKKEVIKAHGTSESVHYAWRLGSLYDVAHVQEPALADYLRLELVGEFLFYASEPSDKDHLRKARDMHCVWKGSRVEGLRAIAFAIEEKLRGRGKQNPLDLDK